jgi:glycerophosphoryl diester phosphodiesterase
MPTIDIIAHRGASYEAPENTLASVRLAWEQNADAVEVDVFLTKDNRIVAIHDVDTYRTAGGTQRIDQHTLEELRLVDVGSWKHTRFAGEPMPSLEEVINTIPDNKRLVIESKCGVQIVPFLQEVLQRSGKPDTRFVHLSASYPTLRASRQAMPGIKTVWLQEFPLDLPENERPAKTERSTLEELIGEAQEAEIAGLSFDLDWPVDEPLIQKIKAAGLECHVWTVDSPEKALQLMKWGIDTITTNRPGWLRERIIIL